MPNDFNEEETAVRLYRLGLIPLYVVVSALVWVIHDYFITLEDEVKYIWSQKPGLNLLIFIWIRYYTILLVLFDAMQIHIFATPGVVTRSLCVATDPITRILGAICLWSIEIMMQLRIYLLFNRSKKVALLNGILFIISIGVFLWIMIENTLRRNAILGSIQWQHGNGCPSINGGTQWAQWIPATLFEFLLFGLALYKTIVSSSANMKLNGRSSLVTVLLHENIVYFLVVACVLIFNNLMVVGATRIPWFGFGPFHAALGIATCRMLIHLRKFASKHLDAGPDHSFPTLAAEP